ncbi:enoyl-CoA hydratase/carnithine racemase [Paraburkholderia sp. EB58]|jgi:acetyl-CoA C-acetyltransferase|uniref:enoyl-CoA hydratase-related protein n=1 Tax=Paraburkholderia sp. EB58 TaxID=3035125 RepID=UPI003D25646D
MPYEFISVMQEGRLTLITINRPGVLNALHPPAHHELATAFDAFQRDSSQWVAIITGAGDRAFCAGNDLKFRVAEGRQRMPQSGFAGLTARFELDKPVLAAVNGLAVGGGFELALACDVIVADERAQFALPEVRVGLAALAGGLHRLPREIGLKAAMGIALTGRRIDAAEAQHLGLVNEVAPTGTSLDVARRWAGEILLSGPLAVRATKQTILRGLDEPGLSEALRLQVQYPAVMAMYASEDATEGPRAFAERRLPRWQGEQRADDEPLRDCPKPRGAQP